MNINIKTNNIENTSDLKNYINKKIESFDKLVNRNDESVSVNFILSKTTNHHQKGDIFQAEVNLHISGKVFQASSESQNIYSAIDFVKDEIIREIRSYKGKKLNIIRRGGVKLKNILKGFYNKR